MVASCWLFLYDLYYDGWNHEHQGKPDINPLHLSPGAETQNVMLYLIMLLA